MIFQTEAKIYRMKIYREFWGDKWAIFDPYLVNIALIRHGIGMKILP